MSIWSNSIIIQQPTNTNLGWAADSKYLIYNSGTPLGRMSTDSYDRIFTKINSGYAISVWVIDRSSNYFCGPVLISTDEDAVRYHCEDIKSPGFSTNLGYNSVQFYFGVRFYVNNLYHLGSRGYSGANFQIIDYANRPVINFSGKNPGEQGILQQAGVHLI